MKLSNKYKGKVVEIMNLNFEDENIVHKLNNMGLVRGNKIKILDYDKSKSLIHIEIFGIEYVLREKDANNIDVKEINN